MGKGSIIRSIYFYLAALVGLLMMVFSGADLINLGLKTWVFPNADEELYYTCPERPPVPAGIETEAAPTGEEALGAKCPTDAQRTQALRRRQSSAIRDISLIVVGFPLFLFHFRVVQRERKENM